MKNNKTCEYFFRYLRKNLLLYVVSLLFVSIGIVIGMYAVKYMGDNEKRDLIEYFLKYTRNINSVNMNKKYIFLQALKSNIPFLFLIWFLGLSMVGLPFILIVDSVKGFTIGFVTSFVINSLGSKGILVNLLTIFPQNIIYITCIIVSSAVAMEFSLNLLKCNRLNNNMKNNLNRVISYSTIFLIIFGVMIVGFFIEGYITSSMLKLLVSNTGWIVV